MLTGNWHVLLRKATKYFSFFKNNQFVSEELHYRMILMSTAFLSMHVQGYCCDGKQKSSGYLWWGGRLIQMYAAQVELQVKDSVGLDLRAML